MRPMPLLTHHPAVSGFQIQSTIWPLMRETFISVAFYQTSIAEDAAGNGTEGLNTPTSLLSIVVQEKKNATKYIMGDPRTLTDLVIF